MIQKAIRWAALAASALALCAGAAPASAKLAVCDGRHRRPANPYGSVLVDAPAPTLPQAAGPKTSAPQTLPARRPTAPAIPPLSQIDPKSVAPCGARR